MIVEFEANDSDSDEGVDEDDLSDEDWLDELEEEARPEVCSISDSPRSEQPFVALLPCFSQLSITS